MTMVVPLDFDNGNGRQPNVNKTAAIPWTHHAAKISKKPRQWTNYNSRNDHLRPDCVKTAKNSPHHLFDPTHSTQSAHPTTC